MANAPNTPGEYEYWNAFDDGATIAPGDVFVICHPSADEAIQAQCDMTFTYLSNGDDGFCLVKGTEASYEIVDCYGDWNGITLTPAHPTSPTRLQPLTDPSTDDNGPPPPLTQATPAPAGTCAARPPRPRTTPSCASRA